MLNYGTDKCLLPLCQLRRAPDQVHCRFHTLHAFLRMRPASPLDDWWIGDPMLEELVVRPYFEERGARVEPIQLHWKTKTELLVSLHRDFKQEVDWRHCHICGHFIANDEVIEYDHVHPSELGGSNAPWNRAPSHKFCNREVKGSLPIDHHWLPHKFMQRMEKRNSHLKHSDPSKVPLYQMLAWQGEDRFRRGIDNPFFRFEIEARLEERKRMER